jgi:cytochrome c556
VKGISFLLVGTILVALAIAQTLEDPTPEHVQVMKDIGKQNGQIKKGIDVAENAKAMAKAMKQVAAFWKGRTSEVAMKTCKECRDGALAIAKAAQADDQAGVKAGMKMVGAGCKGCHDVHREKTGENQYKIKQ